MGKSSKHVYTSGISKSEWSNDDKPPSNGGFGQRSKGLDSTSEPLPSQVETFRRGLAKGALNLPEEERIPALREALLAMGFLTPEQLERFQKRR